MPSIRTLRKRWPCTDTGAPLPAIEKGGSSKTMAMVGWATASGGRAPKVKTSLAPDAVRSSVASTSVSLARGPGTGSVQAAGVALASPGVADGLGAVADGWLGAVVPEGLADPAGAAAEADGPAGVAPDETQPASMASEHS